MKKNEAMPASKELKTIRKQLENNYGNRESCLREQF